jgi:phosphatidylglycerophosphate synthase
MEKIKTESVSSPEKENLRTAAIVPGCANAPNGLIGGLTRFERLRRSLEGQGYKIVDSSEYADSRIPDCSLFVGGQKLHICEEGIGAMEDRLLDSLRKPEDGIISRFINRRFSLAMTRRLMNSKIHPNHISIVTLLLGLSCGSVLALGGYWAGVLGAALLQAQSMIDGVDGELARLRYQGSRLGEWLDTVSDDLGELSFLTGATVVAPLPWLRWFGIAGMVSYVVAKAAIYYQLATRFHSGNLQVFKWELGDPKKLASKLEFFFKHDFLCLLVLILAFINRLDAALFLFSSGAIIMFLKFIQQRMSSRLSNPEKVLRRVP